MPPPLRVGLVSDTHDVFDPTLETLFAGCALILHAGDITRQPVLDALAAIAPVRAVRGNNDFGPLAEGLPETAVVPLGGIAALARAGVVAGLLPLSTLFLRGGRWAPGRRLLDAGVAVAVATNVNPGSAMSESPSLALSLACLGNGLTPAEALVAMTAGGARALRLGDAGRLAPGLQADLVVWGCRSPEHLAWHLGVNHALTVVQRGRVVHQATPGNAADCAEG